MKPLTSWSLHVIMAGRNGKYLSEPLLSNHSATNVSPLSHIHSPAWRLWLYHHIVSTKLFQISILIIIILDLCLILIDSISPHAFLPIHITIQSLFTIEMVLKLFSFGVFHRVHPEQIAFLHHPYHVFDLCIVLSSWITLFHFKITCTALRITFILFFIPSLEMAIITLSVVQSLKSILNVLLFYLHFYVLFGLIGTYFFSGNLHQQCTNSNLSALSVLCHEDSDCSPYTVNQSNGTISESVCQFAASTPMHGLLSFDNVLISSFEIFIASTNHWALSMAATIQTFGHWSIVLYWILVIFIMLFILRPLWLSFVADHFDDVHLAKNRLYLKRMLREQVFVHFESSSAMLHLLI